MTDRPKVSVFIASYNHARYLPACLDSILAQTYQDIEIVVADDGSTDGSHEILLQYQSLYPNRVHYTWHPNHANKGISATCNLAISKTSGEYLAWIGSDDIWYPQKLEQQVPRMDQNPRCGIVYSASHYIDENSNLLPGVVGVDVTRDSNPLGRIIQYCHPPSQSVLIRRACLDDVGIFDEHLVDSDWELFIRIFARWEAAFVDQPLTQYRIHTSNVSKGIDPKISLKRILDMYQAVLLKVDAIGGAFHQPRNRAILSLQLAFHHYCNGSIKEAAEYLSRAFDEDPGLDQDVDFMNDWLSGWKRDFYTTKHSHFGFWLIANLPAQAGPAFRSKLLDLQLEQPDTRSFFIQRGIDWDKEHNTLVTDRDIFWDCPDDIALPQKWKSQIQGALYPELLFKSFRNGNIPKTRGYWKKTIRHNASWLLNRGVLSIGLKVFLRSPRTTIASSGE